jgi:hypothetical protein
MRGAFATAAPAALVILAGLVTGCASLDPTKLVPTAVLQVQTAVGAETALEAQLIDAFRRENESLLFLSHGQYSCGDPNSPLLKKYLSTKDVSAIINSEQLNAYWTKSLKYLDSYVALLDAIINTSKASASEINAYVALGSSAAATIPNMAGAGPALTALGNIAVETSTAIAAERLALAARKAEAPLETAVGYLTKYYPAFHGRELDAFNAWDQCAHEKLLFMRDNPTGSVGKLHPYFTESTGIELDNAYNAYLAQRQQFLGVPPITDALKQIVAQNKALASPALTWEAAGASIQSIIGAYNNVAAATQALQGLN